MTVQSENAYIKLVDAVKEFPSGKGSVTALNGVTLNVYPGELLVITGESGSGKSTLLNIIGGMDELTGGKIFAGGRNLTDLSEKERTMYRRREVGFVFQDYHLMPELSALENVEFIAELAEDPLCAEATLAEVGLTEEAYRRPGQLSGGQQQRVAIARAIVKRPKLILADEPTAALDMESGREVLTVFEKLLRGSKDGHAPALVLVTHNREIAKIADRVINMKNGKIDSEISQPEPLTVASLEW